ncbi:MAG: fluoride efflux transporter CrcB [Planctomycetota bacterium]
MSGGWLAVGAVGLGGCLGALARFGLSEAAHRLAGTGFPYGTLIANGLGCLLIGFVLFFVLEREHVSEHARLLIVTGFLGSLTTFSAFGHETLMLFKDGKAVLAMANVLSNVIIGVLAVAIGAAVASAVASEQPARGLEGGPNPPSMIDIVFQQGQAQTSHGVIRYRVKHVLGEPHQARPAIVFLHGSGECGTDNRRQVAVGLPPVIAKSPSDWPFVVIAPQKPTVESQWEDHAEDVLAALDAEIAAGRVDPDRVVLTGLSQGGHGVWSIAMLAPDRFCAFFSVCGWGPSYTRSESGEYVFNADPENPYLKHIATAVRGKPVRIRHGVEDQVVPVDQSVLVGQAIRASGGEVDIELYDGVDHFAWVPAYEDPASLSWFRRVTSADE